MAKNINKSSDKRRKIRRNTKKSNIKTSKRYVKRRIEIYGILIIMVAVLFFISLFSYTKKGILSESINNYLSYIFGVTKYVFPVLLLIWGISFFIRRVKYLPSWFGWGFFLLFVSISGIISNNFNYSNIFDEILLKTRGGIIGAGIFYGLYKLIGSIGAVVVLSVLLIISILIITKVSLIDVGKKFIKLFSWIKIRSEEDLAKDEKIILKSSNGQIKGASNYSKDIKVKSRADKKGLFRKPADEIVNKPIYTGKQLKIPLMDSGEEEENYRLPPINLLKKSKIVSIKLYKKSVRDNIETLNQLFDDFNLPAKVTRINRGPSVTLYELMLSKGVRVQKLLSLEDDFCVALGSPDLRFLTPIPGRSAIGIEIPNKIRSIITLGDIYSRRDKEMTENLLGTPLGKDFSGNIVYININDMPHILIGGATNSGKSSCLNSIIISLLMKVKPSQVRFIMMDPKMVELNIYNGIPHLLAPVVTNPKKAASILSWAVDEMKNRFKILVENNCKSIEEYNYMAHKDGSKGLEIKPLPYILIFIDELADLMMVAASEVEDNICRIAQLARAVGIHLIVSTQKPIVKIVTGLIKTNIPSRISFKVTDYTDSRVILDFGGAEKLIGRGDMLYLSPSSNRPVRLQGSFVTTKEINMVTNYIKNQLKPEYNLEITERVSRKNKKIIEEDELFYDALKIVVEFRHASASLLQRKLRLGYSRAARIIDQLEDRGLISGYDASKPREARDVLISRDDLEIILEKRKN
ncbi:MAG: DNA translocase FtsK 4TM domain-containing protein [Actinobacteria bacterium]|nr:DNA translocase FtsK 4TM domain-containing protein [Actinomycetota bacterium]MBL7060327.1 DNA translocase FtsK 4TM domain-containing protein [Actinomycetota bacterium]